MSVPAKTYVPGWPDFLIDTNNAQYVRLRDGKPTSEFGGEVCLYGLLEKGYVSRQAQYVPVIDATLENMVLSGGTWMTASQLESMGQTPIVIPDEPILVGNDRPMEEGEPERKLGDDEDEDEDEEEPEKEKEKDDDESEDPGGRPPLFRT